MKAAEIIVWIIVQVLIGYNLILPFVLYLFYLVSKKSPEFAPVLHEADYAIIVTAYEQTDTLHTVVASLLNLKYSNYIIYIVADKCDITSLNFENDKVILLRPPQTLAGNVRSHMYAISNFIRPHELLTIIDSDNLVDAAYLNELDKFFSKGFKAVQGIRKAGNTQTVFAALDAARDHYYHFYDGKLLFELGSSATLSGSGMAFTVELYKEIFQHLDVKGAGFDKVLQYNIVNKNLRIAFAEKAIVYDEKTAFKDQLVNQRARWINTWFKYFVLGFSLIREGISKRSLNQFLFGFILVRPPLFMFIVLSFFFMVINLFLSVTGVILWTVAFMVFIISFIVALISSDAEGVIYRSLLRAPLFVFYQLVSLKKVKNANKHSVATTHFAKSENEILKSR